MCWRVQCSSYIVQQEAIFRVEFLSDKHAWWQICVHWCLQPSAWSHPKPSKKWYSKTIHISLNFSSNSKQWKLMILVVTCFVFSFPGFEVVTNGCCGTGNIEVAILCNKLSPSTCTDVSKYIFWDSYHPTEKAYRALVKPVLENIIGDFFWWMFYVSRFLSP